MGGYNWTPIGVRTGGMMFLGNYDGQNYTISGLYINSTEDDQGLFGVAQGGTIKNVRLKESTIESTGIEVGSLVGLLDSNYPRFGKLENCHSDAEVKGENRVGGLVGLQFSSTIANCSFAGVVEGNSEVGGITGYLHDGQYNQYTEGCENYGTVRGNGCVGGIVGYIDSETVYITKQIRKCISYGNIKCSTNSAGSIVGSANGPTMIANCTGFGQIIHDNSTDGRYFGGIVGYVVNTVNISNSYFKGSTNKAVSKSVDINVFRPIYNGQTSAAPSVESCYAIINRQRFYSDGDFAGWALCNGMGSGYPIQKAVYYVAQFGDSVNSTWFAAQGFEKV